MHTTPVSVAAIQRLVPLLGERAVLVADHPGETLWTATGDVIASYGILRTGYRRGTGWVVVVDRHHPVALVRHLLRFLRRTIQADDLRRVDVQVNPSDPQAVALAYFLGFRCEARLPWYGPHGETMDQYVLLQKERADGR